MLEPKNYIIQIQDSYLAEFLYYWIQHDKPCSLLYQSPKTNVDGITFIKAIVNSNETAKFLLDAKAAIGYKLYDSNGQSINI